jgi:DNA-directed RNA polymerase specialized sigma24 family protein
MNAKSSSPDRELEDLLGPHRLRLLNLIRRLMGPRDASSVDDVYQEVALEIWQKLASGEQFASETFWSYLSKLARWRVIDFKRRKEMIVISQVLGDGQEPVGLEPADGAPSPSHAVREQERSDRKQRLLSEILQSYCRDCESQPRMLKGKEIFERTLRGESKATVIKAMKLTEPLYYAAVHRANGRMRELLADHDQARSVFLTLYAQQADHPLQTQKHNRKLNAEVPEIYTAGDLYRWLFDEAGAMCPAIERLEDYAKAPSAYISDIHYHVSDVRCPLCVAHIEAMREPDNSAQG